MVRAETVEDYPLYEATPSGARKTGLTRRSRVMRLTGLNIPEKYLALSVASRKWSFANTPVNLIHLFGENGEERRLTYGMASNTDLPFVAQGGLDHGVMFDCVIGTPVACFAGFNPAREPFILDLRQGFIAVERGKSRCMDTLGGSLGSPSYAEVRGWWLSWVRAILEAGADGVELRYRNHTSSFNFEEFGFEQPVRDEFLKRAAVDIWETDDFDRSLWRRIRGEGYTEFCREARRMTREAGKTLGLHIDSAMNMEPEEGAAMGIHWDWRMWLREGFADYVLLKEVWPGSLFAQEIVSLARPGRIQVVPSHFAFGCKWKEPGCEQVLDGWLRSARENGCDGFQFCDSAALLHGFSDRQRVLLKNPALRDVLRKHFIKEGR
jgi:hypothetical protein